MHERKTQAIAGRLCVAVTFVLLAGATCVAQNIGISASRAKDIAMEWVGDARAEAIGPIRSSLDHDSMARALAAWSVDLRTPDGWHHGVQVDAHTGVVLSWCRYRGERVDSANEQCPVLTLDESRQVAEKYAAEKHPSFVTGRWVSALGSPRKGQMSFQWAWYEVVDASSGALGPSELFVEVSDQVPEVITFWRPAQVPIVISTRPSIGRAEMLAVARRFAILDPARYPVNHLTLRVQMDDYGSQRLVWECLQVLSVDAETGVEMYGVVHDAHTGEPLYPIAPFGGGKYPTRSIRLPRHASIWLEPGRRAVSTQLCPPVADATGLWLRAEHLRAIEGLRVGVERQGVTVRRGDLVLRGKDLGAQWRDSGWWIPLRHAAKLLGWRVAWNNGKKEAVIFTR